jgi:hypothetical protein
MEDCTGSGNHFCGRMAEMILVVGKGDHTKNSPTLGFPLTHCLYGV